MGYASARTAYHTTAFKAPIAEIWTGRPITRATTSGKRFFEILSQRQAELECCKYFLQHSFVVLVDAVLDADLQGLRQATADLIDAAETRLPTFEANLE